MKSMIAMTAGAWLGALVAMSASALLGPVSGSLLPANISAASSAVSHHHVTREAAISSDASGDSPPGFYSEVAEANARMHTGMDIEPHGDVDGDFIRMMVPHHQGAIDMALVLLKYGRDERLKRLAQAIIVEQGQEIAYMRSLLTNTDIGRSETGAK